MRFIRQLFCTHQWQFVRNLHGDEIIARGYMRSLWRCARCGKEALQQDLGP